MIDWDRVVELHDELGAEEFNPVLEMFIDEVEGVVMRLQSDDAAELESSLHFLKGCAWNLGFAEFGAICQRGEAMAARGSAQQVSIDELVACYSTSKQMFIRDLARVIDPDAGGNTDVA